MIEDLINQIKTKNWWLTINYFGKGEFFVRLATGPYPGGYFSTRQGADLEQLLWEAIDDVNELLEKYASSPEVDKRFKIKRKGYLDYSLKAVVENVE